MASSRSLAFLLLVSSLIFTAHTCQCFTVPATKSVAPCQGFPLHFCIQKSNDGDDDDDVLSRQKQPNRVLEAVKKSPKHTKKLLSILGASMAFLAGANVEVAHAARPPIKAERNAARPPIKAERKRAIVKASTKQVQGDEHKISFPAKTTVVVTAGSAVAFTIVQRARKNARDDDDDETIEIPERPSLEELKEQRIDKLEEMQTELNDNMHINGFPLPFDGEDSLDEDDKSEIDVSTFTTPVDGKDVEVVDDSVEMIEETTSKPTTLVVDITEEVEERLSHITSMEESPPAAATEMTFEDTGEILLATSEVTPEASNETEEPPEVTSEASEETPVTSEASDDTSQLTEEIEVTPEASNHETKEPSEVTSEASEETPVTPKASDDTQQLTEQIESKVQLAELRAEWKFLMEDADLTTAYPLQDEQFVHARRQPKSAPEEAALAAKYAAIEDLMDRAYQILVDLGMIEETQPIDMDKFIEILEASW
jgi:hypothetical protein